MVIVLLAAPGLPADLRAQAAWNGETAAYACVATNDSATLLACEGPLIPLGNSVHLDVTSADGDAPIASGDFVLNALALPTLAAAADLPPTDAATITPRPTRTPGVGTPYPNPTP